jgi:hypothetical protein
MMRGKKAVRKGVAACVLALSGSLYAQDVATTTGWHALGNEGRALLGTVSAVSADHFAVKTERGVPADVYFSANTRILEQQLPAKAGVPVDCLAMAEAGQMEGTFQPVKAAAIQRRDVIVAGGRVDAKTGQVGAVVIAKLAPACARQAKERAKEYGKTWLAGRVTAIAGKRVTLETVMDPAPASFTITDATVVKQQQNLVPVSTMRVGDLLRVDGVRRHGEFAAKSIALMERPHYPRPRGGPVLPHGSEPLQ